MQEMRIYLLNNTKPYHDEDDGYSGDWFNCPVDFELAGRNRKEKIVSTLRSKHPIQTFL